MPTFLSDPPLAGLITLGVLALIAGGLWLRYRGKALLAVAALLVVLLLVWLLVCLMFESPREEAVRRVNDMAAAVNAKDWTKFSENVSESFADGSRKKKDLKPLFERAGQYDLRAVVWDFAPTDPPRMSNTEVVISFEGKASPPTGEPFLRRFEATFVKDPDGKFRLQGYTTFQPSSTTPGPIPFAGQ